MRGAGQTAIMNLYINKELPSDKDWVIKMIKLHRGWYMGDSRMSIDFVDSINDIPTFTNNVLIDYFSTDEKMATYNNPFQNVYIIKKGNTLAYLTQDNYSTGAIKVFIYPYNNAMRFMKIQDMGESVQPTKEKFSYSSISYWIQP